MNKAVIATTGVLGALAAMGTVGLVMSAKKTSPRRMAKKTGKMIDAMGNKMQNVINAIKS